MRPYSMDLRERVAAAIDAGEGSQRQVAKRFRVSVSFVTRLVQRRRDASPLAPKPHGAGRGRPSASPNRARLAMRSRAPRCHPETTEGVGRLRLHADDPLAHPPPLPPDLQEEDPACRRARHSRSAGQAAEYRAKVRRIEAKRLVFVDETGVNTAMTPTHAWARRGERAKGSVPSRGVRRP